MGNNPTTVLPNHTATTRPSIMLDGRPSHRSAGLRILWSCESADATEASLLVTSRHLADEAHLPHYPALSFSRETWTVSQTQHRYWVPREGAATAPDPWEELERLGKLVAASWQSEKSGVELLLEERR